MGKRKITRRSARNKGDRLEEKIASIIKEEWGLEDFNAHRAQGSGNYSLEIGDVKLNFGFYVPIYIECKNREEWKYKHLVTFSSHIRKWWETECIKPCIDFYGKTELFHLPLLAFTKNYQPNFIMYDTRSLTDFLSENKETFHIDRSAIKDIDLNIQISYAKGNGKRTLEVMFAEDFFKFFRKTDK